MQFFRSKDELFGAVMAAPVSAMQRFNTLYEGLHQHLGERVVRAFLTAWEGRPEESEPLMATLRGAMVNDQARDQLRDFIKPGCRPAPASASVQTPRSGLAWRRRCSWAWWSVDASLACLCLSQRNRKSSSRSSLPPFHKFWCHNQPAAPRSTKGTEPAGAASRPQPEARASVLRACCTAGTSTMRPSSCTAAPAAAASAATTRRAHSSASTLGASAA